MSLFRSWNKWLGRTLLSRQFSLPCDKRLTLYSRRPSLPAFSLMFLTPLNFKCPTQLKPQIRYLFLTRYWNLVTATKKPNSGIVTWLMTSLPQMWHGKIFYGKCYLVVVWQSSKNKIVKVIKLFNKLSQRILGNLMIMIIYFYSYVYTLSVQLVASSRYKSHPATLIVENPSEDSCCS